MKRFGPVLLGIVMPILSAMPVSAACAAILDDFGRPAKPEEARQLRNRIQSLEMETGLNRQTIEGIARRLGAKGGKLGRVELFRRLEALVQDAHDLQDKIKGLDRDLAALRDPALRDPGVAIMARAQAAFDKADFAAAEVALGELSYLRGGGSVESINAWRDAMFAQADAAQLQGGAEDYDRATAIVDRAIAEWRRMSADVTLGFLAKKVAVGLREGEVEGRRRGLDRAIRTWEGEIEGKFPEGATSEHMVQACLDYARAQELQALRAGGQDGLARLNRSFTALRGAAVTAYGEDVAKFPASVDELFVRNFFAQVQLSDLDVVIKGGLSGENSVFVNKVTAEINRRLSGFSDFKNIGKLNRDQVETFVLFASILTEFLSREDVLSYTVAGSADKSPGDAQIRDVTAMIDVMGTMIGGAVVMPDGPLSHVIDREADPRAWLKIGIFGASSVYRFVQTSEKSTLLRSIDKDVEATKASGLALAMQMLTLLKPFAEQKGFLVDAAEADHLMGQVLNMQGRLVGVSAADAASHLKAAEAHYQAALDVRSLDDMPVEWGETSMELAGVEEMLGVLEPLRACMQPGHGGGRALAAIAALEGRVPRYRLEQYREAQAAMARRQVAHKACAAG